MEAVERVRRSVPDIALSSDFIVGFPGESEEDFEATLDLVRRVRFASLFAFVYSPRPGTAAARWGSEQSVPAGTASARLQRLLAAQEEIQSETNRGLVGRTFEVLVEGADRHGQSRGRTPCNRIVHIEGGRSLPVGQYSRIRIVRGLPNSLLGEAAG